jgi:hypothetical protein
MARTAVDIDSLSATLEAIYAHSFGLKVTSRIVAAKKQPGRAHARP